MPRASFIHLLPEATKRRDRARPVFFCVLRPVAFLPLPSLLRRFGLRPFPPPTVDGWPLPERLFFTQTHLPPRLEVVVDFAERGRFRPPVAFFGITFFPSKVALHPHFGLNSPRIRVSKPINKLL